MIPKFRAWIRKDKSMNNVECMNFDFEHVFLSGWRESFNIKDIDLMQSTGLKDKNGIEIFEGDICRLNRIPSNQKQIFVVEDYIKEKIIFLNVAVMGQNSYEVQGGYTGEFLEIIGNIYENPNLLGEI